MKRIAEYRRALGWSQKTLAEKAGVSLSTIWRWERGRISPGADDLERIAESLGVNVAELFDVNPTNRRRLRAAS